MPMYALIIIAALVLLFICIGFYICIILRKNKTNQMQHEMAIAHELEVAKREGVEIPDDLEKRIGKLTRHDPNSKSSVSSGYAKVHPDLAKSGGSE